MADIVTRLQCVVDSGPDEMAWPTQIAKDAIVEIRRLRAKRISKLNDHYDRDGYCDNPGRGY
jgi:hypothetical protein